MNESRDANAENVETELLSFFQGLCTTAKALGWQRDSTWTRAINTHVATIGRRRGFLVFASRCDCEVDGREWLYDHHWRMVNSTGNLIRIPLAMEIEWG